MTRIHNPPHPGETLREDVLPALGLTVTEAAAQVEADRCGGQPREPAGSAGQSPGAIKEGSGWSMEHPH